MQNKHFLLFMIKAQKEIVLGDTDFHCCHHKDCHDEASVPFQSESCSPNFQQVVLDVSQKTKNLLL